MTAPVFSCTIRPTLIGKTLFIDLWCQRNGEKKSACLFRSALTDLNEKLHLHVEGKTTVQALVMFSQRWPAHYNNITSVTREDSGKSPMNLDYRDKLFPTSLDKFVRLSSSSWVRLTLHQTPCTEPEVMELIIGEFCHSAWELLTAHIKVKQPLANFHRLDNRNWKHSFNEQVLCDIKWSCNMHAVWLERRATELTPRIWTRNVFGLRPRHNFRM